MKMVLQLAVQDIGQLTYLVPPLGQGHYATAETTSHHAQWVSTGSFTKNMDVLFL
jgi:hypothetical protein